MAKNQSRKPGRDVRGGGAGAAKGGAGSYRSGVNKGSGSGGRGTKGSYQAANKAAGSGKGTGSSRGANKAAGKGGGSGKGAYQAAGSGRGATKPAGSPRGAGARPSSAGRSDLIEGRRAVEEALACGMPLKGALVLARTGEGDSDLELLARRLDETGVPVERVSRARLDALSSHGAHQGVVVRTRPFEYAELADVIAAAGQGDALVVVLDHVTDQGNLGAIVRSAEVVGAAGVVVAKARSASVGVGAYKTSAGAVLHLPIAQVPNLARALDELKRAGFWACCASEHAEQDVWHAPMGGRLALVVGSEGEGVSRLVAQSCDFSCRLPQRGRIESLNVAQATTVLCYEWLRRVELGEGAGAADPGGVAVGGPAGKTGTAPAVSAELGPEAEPAGWLSAGGPDGADWPTGAEVADVPGDFVADALADLGFGGYEPDALGDGLDG